MCKQCNFSINLRLNKKKSGRVRVRGPRSHRGLRSRLIRETAVPAVQVRSPRDFVVARTGAREVRPRQLNVDPTASRQITSWHAPRRAPRCRGVPMDHPQPTEALTTGSRARRSCLTASRTRLTTMARRTALSSPRSRSRRRWTTASAAAKTSSPPCGASLCRLPSLGEASPHRRTRRGRRVGTTKTKGSRGSRVAASLSRPVGGQCIWFSRSAQLGGLRVAAFWGVCFGELASISVYGMHAFCCAFCCVSCFVC